MNDIKIGDLVSVATSPVLTRSPFVMRVERIRRLAHEHDVFIEGTLVLPDYARGWRWRDSWRRCRLLARPGAMVTIWPNVGIGESRDTDPGLQPWNAECVAIALNGDVFIEAKRPFLGDVRRVPVERLLG